ncbi:MAG: hydroxylamine reductase [Deltaproteobacteria bacterium]|nr:hydroxylamine reductase [Deltaproteobacteria bacterium]
MFCYQCEQTAQGQGCTKGGVCGKSPEIAALQDLLTYALRGLALYAQAAGSKGLTDASVNAHAAGALFTTLTNVNFDAERIQALIAETVAKREALKQKITDSGGAAIDKEPAALVPAEGLDALIEQAAGYGLDKDASSNPDIKSLQHILLFGIRGVAAYADHARILGQEDQTVYDFLFEALAAQYNPDLTLDDWIQYCLKCGEINLKAMELLDAANTGIYGHPEPTPVSLGAKKGKAILISGHDLKDLSELLKQTEGKGINIYTHGEMIPCHAYPELKKHSHLVGHYGTAWQNQKKEFDAFPGAILMTTNCIQKPAETYHENIFTTGLVGWPGVKHIGETKDFSPVIERALALPGFESDSDGKTVMTGFARNAVMGVAGTVIDAVKSKALRHFFLVAGCDGAKPGRNYYTEFVEKVPEDCVVLTLACGKFRFFDKDLGDIGGIPRLLDVGQCNDAYSAVQIAVALAGAFECGVNDLPLSLVLSWYEQKAVAILLSLLHLGIKDIRLGPSLPAFITPNVLNVLVETFDIKPISTPDEDLKAILG